MQGTPGIGCPGGEIDLFVLPGDLFHQIEIDLFVTPGDLFHQKKSKKIKLGDEL